MVVFTPILALLMLSWSMASWDTAHVEPHATSCFSPYSEASPMNSKYCCVPNTEDAPQCIELE